MNIRSKLKGVTSVLKVKFMNRRVPLAVRFQLTNRCTSRCYYCNIWKTPSRELSTSQVFSVLDQLAGLGTMVISFSGGDVLLREDIGEIINYCKKKNIRPEINSNGCLVPAKIESLKDLALIKLSLDGPEDVHDVVRGRKGSYREVINAATAAKEKGIRFSFATTLTRYNIDSIDFLLETAERFGTIIAFQPLKLLYRGVDDIDSIAPSRDKYKKAIKRIIYAKKRGNKHIRNSLIELDHIINWPDYKKLRCWAGRIFCMINTDGDVYPCDRPHYDVRLPNCTEIGLNDALMGLPEVSCRGCGFCGTLELNLLTAFKVSVLDSIKRLIN